MANENERCVEAKKFQRIDDAFHKGDLDALRADFNAGAYYAPFWAIQVLAAWVEEHQILVGSVGL